MRRLHRAGTLPDLTEVLRRDSLRIPIHFALGHYEAATDEELHELIADLTAEVNRRG